jgi:hypothetical protein
MGFRGVAMKAGMLHRLPAMTIPHVCWLADDVAVTYFLSFVNHFQVRRLRLRSKYRFDDDYAWSNSSINAFHRERKFRVNKACITSLRLDTHDRQQRDTTVIQRRPTLSGKKPLLTEHSTELHRQ